MKKLALPIGFLLFISCYADLFAQNKTLGVGTTTPNPNAALHVESPAGNQGFILPRLTTAQRIDVGFTSVLTAVDNGLMVYDSDLKEIFVWQDNVWVGLIAVPNKPINITSTSGTGAAANFSINNASNGNAALIVNTVGTGAALQLNPSSNGMAIEMVRGGLKYSVVDISATGQITQVAGLYKITIAGTYSLPTNVPEGTLCKVYFTSGDPNGFIVIDPVWESGAPSAQSVYPGFEDFIFVNGYWHLN